MKRLPQNPPEILCYEDFRILLAKWLLANSRSVPRNASARQDFIDGYRPPEFDWRLSQHYAGADGRLYMHFRSELHLLSCQTRDGRAPRSLTVWQIRSRAEDEGEEEQMVGFGVTI